MLISEGLLLDDVVQIRSHQVRHQIPGERKGEEVEKGSQERGGKKKHDQ